MTAKVIAQLGATIGRQFGYELLYAVAQLDEPTLQRELGRLVEAELLYQRGLPPHATYTFKHALIQDIAYESLLRSTRQSYHRRIAEVLEEQFPTTVETQPELLAHHCTEAGLNEQSISYWHKAGEAAIQRSANVEAISHLTKGLELLEALPEMPNRTQQELVLQLSLGPVFMATKGQASPEVEATYTRAHALCQQLGETAQLFPILWGLWRFANARTTFQTSRELGEQLLTFAQRIHDDVDLAGAYYASGMTLYWLGEFIPARKRLEQGVDHYDARQHRVYSALFGQDPGVACLSRQALVLWHLGYPDQARQCSQKARTLAQKLAHPLSLTYAFVHAAWLHQMLAEEVQSHEYAEAAIVLAREQNFAYWLAWSCTLRGWITTVQGQREQGLIQLQQGLRTYRATGTTVTEPYYLALLAQSYERVGQVEDGLRMLTEALVLVDKTGERWYEPELHRLKGELLLAQSPDNQTEAETCFHQAIAIAQNQSAKSWELRAATSLARSWQRQGKRQEAYDLLAPVYGWFTEGFVTADLKAAKRLLDKLE